MVVLGTGDNLLKWAMDPALAYPCKFTTYLLSVYMKVDVCFFLCVCVCICVHGVCAALLGFFGCFAVMFFVDALYAAIALGK